MIWSIMVAMSQNIILYVFLIYVFLNTMILFQDVGKDQDDVPYFASSVSSDNILSL